MRKSKKITLLKSGNRIVVKPTTPTIRDLLGPRLTFTEKKFAQGWEARERRINHELPFDLIDWECFGEDHRGRLSTSFGFWKLIKDTLQAKGYRVVVEDTTPHPRPQVFEPLWERLQQFDIKLRPSQPECLAKLLSCRNGRISCPPGYGKTFLIGVMALLCPKARIDIVTRRVPVACERIYPELATMLPDVGIVGGGKRREGHRVMVYTAGSMHYANGDADFLFGDEGHELVSDDTAGKFARWDMSRNFAFSASWDMRMDHKDLRAEGIFGPIVYKVKYDQAEDMGMVVPIKVIWRYVNMDYDPCEGADDMTTRKRRAYWKNDYRNNLIAKDARGYDADTQVLITCETLEHAVNLKKRLPEFTLVYRAEGMSAMDRRHYIKRGYLKADEPFMTEDRKIRLTRAFEKGRLKKVICTTVWNVGVSFNRLAVLVRADGGGSAINDTQIPGRVSRTHSDKFQGIVHDYTDHFNTGCRRKAENREKNYDQNGWEQVHPQKDGGSLCQRLLW